MKSPATVITDLVSQPERSSGGRSAIRHSVPWGKQNRPSDSYIFRRKYYKPNFLHILIPRKSIKIINRTSALVTHSNTLPRFKMFA